MRKIAKIVQAISYWPTYFLLKLFLRFQIEGQENLRGLENKPIIFASNHTSYLDSLLGAISLPRTRGFFYPSKFFPVRFLATEKLYKFRNLPVVLFIWLHGSIKIRKCGGDLETSLKKVISLLKEGERVWIFPEGKRSADGTLQQGKRGVAYLHKETGVPIVPVAIIGKSRIVFSKPIYSLGECSLEQGADKVMSVIKELMK